MLKKVFFSVFVISVLIGLGGCSYSSDSSDEQDKQMISVGYTTGVSSLDPSLAVDPTSYTVINNVMEGLYRLDQDGLLTLGIAEDRPDISEDGLTYKINLKDNAKWSDGKKVTAEDFVYGWKRTVASETKSPNISLFEHIKNAKNIFNGKESSDNLGVRATGNHSIEIVLASPVPYFSSLLAMPAYFPQRKDIVEKNGDKYAMSSDNMVYNGPFLLSGFTGPGTTDGWLLKKNDLYWESDKVRLQEISMSVVNNVNTGVDLFQSGELDDVPLAGEFAKQYKTDKNYVVENAAAMLMLEVNQRENANPFLQNKQVRQAISKVIDRELLVKQIISNGSVKATSLVPKDLMINKDTKTDFSNGKDMLPFDGAKAKDLWDTAKKSLSTESVTLNILTNDQDLGKKGAEFLQGELEKQFYGLTIQITAVPANEQYKRLAEGDFDLSLSGVMADYPDAYSILSNFIENSPTNNGEYVSSEYDELLDAANTKYATDYSERWNTMQKAEKTIIEDAGIIPLFQMNSARLRRSTVKNVVVHSSGAKYDFKRAFVSTK